VTCYEKGESLKLNSVFREEVGIHYDFVKSLKLSQWEKNFPFIKTLEKQTAKICYSTTR
jgi:hypothetical protein